MKVTATEEYPHFRPWQNRRGFIHKQVKVRYIFDWDVYLLWCISGTPSSDMWSLHTYSILSSLSRRNKQINVTHWRRRSILDNCAQSGKNILSGYRKSHLVLNCNSSDFYLHDPSTEFRSWSISFVHIWECVLIPRMLDKTTIQMGESYYSCW